MKIKDLSKIERPREKLIAKGPDNLKDAKEQKFHEKNY